jgi:hypothetical protein
MVHLSILESRTTLRCALSAGIAHNATLCAVDQDRAQRYAVRCPF